MSTCVKCDRQVQADSKWASIRAQGTGWYFHEDGRAFCPDHRPNYAPARKQHPGWEVCLDQSVRECGHRAHRRCNSGADEGLRLGQLAEESK